MNARFAIPGLLALALLAGCGDEGGEDGGLLSGLVGEPPQHVPKAEQRALPTAAYTLPDIACPPSYYDPKTAAQVAKDGPVQTRAFFRALRDHPDKTVTASYSLAHPEEGEDPIQTEEITILQLAEQNLSTMEDVEANPGLEKDISGAESYRCRVKLKRKLERLIEQAG
jgi:hypothetical protein